MKKISKVISYCAIALLFGVALSSCKKNTPADPAETTIRVWSFEDEDVWKPIIKSYSQKNKGYSIVYTKQALDDQYENKVLNSILSGDGPDVWAMPNDWVYRHKDKLLPLSTAKAIQTIGLDKYTPAIKESVFIDNKIYALSPYAEPMIVYYNDEIFKQAIKDFNTENTGKENAAVRAEASKLLDKPPLTWTDFAQAAKMLTKQDESGNIEISGAAMGTSGVSASSDILYLLMLQNETKIVADNLQAATFNLPQQTPKDTEDTPGQRALDFYSSFADAASDNYTWDGSIENEIDAFAEGQVAMIFGYDSLRNYFSQKYPNFRYKRAAVPQLTNDYTKSVDYAKFNVFGVTALTAKYTNKPAKCWGLIQLLAGDSASDFNSALNVPSSKINDLEIKFDDRDTANPEKISLRTAQSFIKGRYPNEFDQAVRAMIDGVVDGSEDSKTALDLTANNLTQILTKGSW